MSLGTRPNSALSPRRAFSFKTEDNALIVTFLFYREAATDDESEVFESLLDDPILSSSTADAITIVDGEGGLEGKEVAEKVDSEEKSDAEGELSPEDCNVVESEEDGDDEEDEDEGRDTGKQNSNDPTNLPCDHKYGSPGFQGCDAKCQVEDLTPYQVGKQILSI